MSTDRKAITIYNSTPAPMTGAAVRKIATPDKRTAPASKVAAPALKAATQVKAPAIQRGMLATQIPQEFDAHATFIYYWPKYWDAKKSGRFPLLKLSSNQRDMREILPGCVVWACTRRPRDGAKVVVGRYFVARAGQHREDDPDRRKGGRRFFESDSTGFTPFDPEKQENIGEVIQQALIDQKRKASGTGQYIRSHTVRRIGRPAAEKLERVAGFAPFSCSAGEAGPSGPQNIPDTLRQGEQRLADAIGIGPLNADSMPFDPESVADGRARIEQSIIVRRGQQGFRDELLEAYDRRCAITGCDVVDVLEAAHVTPYLGKPTNDVTNGLLLRADLHTLFDCLLLAINPESRRVVLHDRLRNSQDYRHLHDLPLRRPVPASMAPSPVALKKAWRIFLESSETMEVG